ncbi:MAG TPA: hypothetical protein GXZ58_07450 [Bacilli bacterium]|nr:hypothetical protein [Bacilli bacterium]
MIKSNLRNFLAVVLLTVLFILTACGGGGSDDEIFSIDDFEQIKTNEDEAIEGGTITQGNLLHLLRTKIIGEVCLTLMV